MDKKIFKYRKKHKRCKYCKYYRTDGCFITAFGIFENYCKAKNTIIHNINFPRILCSCYEVKDEF